MYIPWIWESTDSVQVPMIEALLHLGSLGDLVSDLVLGSPNQPPELTSGPLKKASSGQDDLDPKVRGSKLYSFRRTRCWKIENGYSQCLNNMYLFFGKVLLIQRIHIDIWDIFPRKNDTIRGLFSCWKVRQLSDIHKYNCMCTLWTVCWWWGATVLPWMTARGRILSDPLPPAHQIVPGRCHQPRAALQESEDVIEAPLSQLGPPDLMVEGQPHLRHARRRVRGDELHDLPNHLRSGFGRDCQGYCGTSGLATNTILFIDLVSRHSHDFFFKN